VGDMNEHWRICHIEGCSGLLCGGVKPEPEPNWRSLYEILKEHHTRLAREANEITAYTRRPLSETVMVIRKLEEQCEILGGALEG
jgi:hypothetical protein